MIVKEKTKEHKILILATLSGGYRGADAAGQSHLEYPPNSYILPVRTAAMFPPEFYLNALRKGFDGIIVMYSGTDSPYKGESERTAEIINKTYTCHLSVVATAKRRSFNTQVTARTAI